MLSIDTETTGSDFYHGARPYLVTICRENGEQLYWEWDVNPLTREPIIPPSDLQEIKATISRQDIVGQNIKFDVTGLAALDPAFDRWPWERTHDTLLAGHLLASSQPHDLTSMSTHYLGPLGRVADVQHYEDALEEAVKACRRLVQQARLRTKRGKAEDPIALWRIAEPGLPEMPSAKGEVWKADGWLPRATARHLWETSEAGRYYARYGPCQDVWHLEGWGEFRPPEVDREHGGDGVTGINPWYTVTAAYANADSAVTLALWKVLRPLIEGRKLWAIYEERRKAQPIAYRMEKDGITLNADRLDALRNQYVEESVAAEHVCVGLAKGYGYDLALPKSGNNKSLLEFCFGRPAEGDTPLFPAKAERFLDLPVVGRTETGNPSLDKAALESYLTLLPDRSKQRLFVERLREKRSRDTAVNYLTSYERFRLPWVGGGGEADVAWHVLHPSLNQTGTQTLRWSSSNPNEQNISKKEGFNLRYVFGPAPGREWWSLDAKNIELRIPFYLSGETELIDLFERPDDPPYYGSVHLLNFHTVYADLWEKELKEVGFEKVGPHCKKKYAATWYQYNKNGGFCKQYGGGREKTDATFRRPGAYDLLNSRFSKLEGYNQYWIRYAEKHGYVETVPDRSVDPERGYPVMCTRTDYGRILSTVPLNYHVQSTAMWWTQKAMIRVQEQLDRWRAEDGFDGHLVMQVHDELVLDLPKRGDPAKENSPVGLTFKKSNLWRVRAVQRVMAAGGEDIGVPTPVGCEYHPETWSEGVTL